MSNLGDKELIEQYKLLNVHGDDSILLQAATRSIDFESLYKVLREDYEEERAQQLLALGMKYANDYDGSYTN